MKIRPRVVERGIPQSEEAPDVPFAQHRFLGIDIDREIEEIRNHRHSLAVARKPPGLQHVDALDDQNVRPVDLDPFVRDDIVGQMRIYRRSHRPPPGLDIAQERKQRRQVVAFRKALFLHQALPLEHRIGKQKAVGRHQIDLRARRPARQQRLQHASCGRFSYSHRSGDANNVGHLAVFNSEKAPLLEKQPLRGPDIDRQ